MSDQLPQTENRTIIRLLGRMLGEVIGEQQGMDAFDKVETLRQRSVGEHRDGVGDADLGDLLDNLTPSDALLLIRAFSIFSQLANSADDYAARQELGAGPQRLQQLKSHARLTPERVQVFLKQAVFVPVLTAHPSEVRRKSIIDREIEMGELLDARAQCDDAGADEAEIDAQLKREIRTLWQTRMLRAVRIHVTDEIDNNLSVFVRTFLTQVPEVKRRIARMFGLGHEVTPFIRPGSWVGGDRDGNPNISAETLDYAVRRQSTAVLDHYLAETHALGAELTLSDELVATSEALKALGILPEHVAEQQRDEPYRRALTHCYARLAATRIERIGEGPARAARFKAEAYASPHDFAADLDVIAGSLVENGSADLSLGRLADLREAVAAFGFHLATMDVRQNSEVHERVIAELLRAADVEPEYLKLDEASRTQFLLNEITHARLLHSPYVAYSAETMRELDIAKRAAALKRDFGDRAVGNYVISKAGSVSDLLETAVLMKEAGLLAPGAAPRASLSIVPLFETIDDLRRSETIMADYFKLPLIRDMIGAQGFQEVMIGYSDSNKDGGYFTSSWEIRAGVSRLVALGKRHNIPLRFFHGRGGTVGRGGGSSFEAIRALPVGASAHGIRITEQGEVVASKYGDPKIGRASLETIVAAALLAELDHEPDAAEAESALLEELSKAAYKTYRALVYGTPGFEVYFAQSTPLSEISDLKIGSRPASRSISGRIEDLRAIPWVFSWSQARVMLPGWFGLGSAAEAVGLDRLKPLYESSAFFRTTIDNLEMVLAKSSLPIARQYADLAEDKALANDVFARIEQEWHRTVKAVLAISGQTGLLERHPRLRDSIRNRLPYIDALNHLQVRLMKKRRAGDASEEVQRGILMSINGVSAGLRNSG